MPGTLYGSSGPSDVGDVFSVLVRNLSALIDNLLANGLVASIFGANTMVKADVDDTPVAFEVPPSMFVGRKATGGIGPLSPAEAGVMMQAQLDGASAAAVAAATAASQPVDSDLTAIAALATTSYGRAFLALADAPAGRTALNLGSMATQAASAVAITGGTVAGITDLAVADGGTGASSAAAARANLGAEAAIPLGTFAGTPTPGTPATALAVGATQLDTGLKTFQAVNEALIPGATWSANFRADNLLGGSPGLKLRRPDTSNALAISFLDGATDGAAITQWEIGEDAGTTNMVLLYSPTGAAHEIGDYLRARKGSTWELGRSVSVPGLGTRLRISADSIDPATLQTMQELAIGAGTNAALLNFLVCSENGVTKHSFGRDGSLNATGQGVFSGGVLSNRIIGGDNAGAVIAGDKGGFISNAASLAASMNGVSVQLTGGQKWRLTAGIVNEAVAGAALRSDTNGVNVLAFDGAAGAGSMLVRARAKFADGTIALPSVVFEAEPTTGLHRGVVAGTLGVSVLGALVGYWSAGGLIIQGGDIAFSAISKGPLIKSPDGTQYRIVAANGGALSTVAA